MFNTVLLQVLDRDWTLGMRLFMLAAAFSSPRDHDYEIHYQIYPNVVRIRFLRFR